MLRIKNEEEENEICAGCGHEAKSHDGFSCWDKCDWGYCHKYPECGCKKFRPFKRIKKGKQQEGKDKC